MVVGLVAAFAVGAGAVHADARTLATLTVAKDGSGNFSTVQAAVDAVVAGTPTTIMIKPGLYREVVHIQSTKTRLTMVGTTGNPADVVIDFDNASGTLKPDGT